MTQIIHTRPYWFSNNFKPRKKRNKSKSKKRKRNNFRYNNISNHVLTVKYPQLRHTKISLLTK